VVKSRQAAVVLAAGTLEPIGDCHRFIGLFHPFEKICQVFEMRIQYVRGGI